jgi:hypothetical protein
MPDVMYPGGNTEENGSATARYDCAFQSKKSGSNAQPWVASAPSPASRAQQDDDFPNAASSAASTQDSFSGATTTEAEALSEHMVLDMKPRLDGHQSPSQRSFASLQGAPTVSSATASVARHVFGEMPTPISGQGTQGIAPKCCSGHTKPIQISCLRSVSTNPGWQNLDGVPQAYGFHNLNRQSLYLADGTEQNYFTLPADYSLQQSTPPVSNTTAKNVGVTTPPSVACLAPGFCSKANNTASSESMLIYNLQVPTPMQDASCVFKEMAIYDVYEDVTDCRSCVRPAVYTTEIDTEEVEVKVDSGKPVSTFERPTDSIFSFANEKKSDAELLAMCFKNTSINAFSGEATDLTSTDVPRFFVEESIECKTTNNDTKLHALPHSELGNTIEQPVTQLWNKLLNEAGRQKWDLGIAEPSFMDLCLYWHHDIKFNGIALWLMTFNPP